MQQAAEKLLKAWVALLGDTYPLTHDLGLPFDLLKNRGADVSSFSALTEFTPYAVQFRYEAIDLDAAPIKRQESLGLVDSLLARVQRELRGVEGR